MTHETSQRALNHDERQVLALIKERPGISRSGICARTGISVGNARDVLRRLLAGKTIEMREVPERGYGSVARRYWVHP